mmetsp:Transcript_28485/g.80218  ORF Transcript_28485/g.80218 Transcript_28485/m.80218 type:complete len:537 (-) Transcript_28485:329-1939(-)
MLGRHRRAMSEAQYISTGDPNISSLNHYGLGLDRYTHFTSPIRRYADVVVHKQLLCAIGEMTIPRSATLDAASSVGAGSSTVARVKLASIPASNVISIMHGEGLEQPSSIAASLNDDDNEQQDHGMVVPSLVAEAPGVEVAAVSAEGASGTANGGFRDDKMASKISETKSSPYLPETVTRICDGLNHHNRIAKLSSMECQKLFLSLYFKERVETTDAVVTALRSNGFMVYVPKFDLRGPVYVSDSEGNVQIDPSLVGLPESAGLPPTLGFRTTTTKNRLFTAGRCKLVDSSPGNGNDEADQEMLQVDIPSAKRSFSVKKLDVVTVTISSSDWDVRARIPTPRFQLEGKGIRAKPKHNARQQQQQQRQQKRHAAAAQSIANANTNTTTAVVNITSKTFQQFNEDGKEPDEDANGRADAGAKVLSMYEALMALQTPPVVTAPYRHEKSRPKIPAELRVSSMKGRYAFSGFINPDTRMAQQEAAIEAASEAAAMRRAQTIEQNARNNEFDTTRQIQHDVTMRMNKLAAQKRNAKKAKAR